MKIQKKSVVYSVVTFFLLFSVVFPSLIPLSRISLSGDNTPNPASSTPAIIWTANGIPINTANNSQGKPNIISDGAGGAIIVWQDERDLLTTGIDIYAQRIDSNGNLLWDPNGVPISTVDDDQSLPELVSDGAGGAIITWQDWRDRSSTELNIYAQRINSSGDSLWTPNGTSICSANQIQSYAEIISDGAGGAVIIWHDNRGNSIYAQNINSSGDIQWNLDGILVAGGAYWPHFISDGEGGVIIVWGDVRSGSLGLDIYIQKINSSGVPQWTPGGTAISTELYNQERPQLVEDGEGNIIIAWQDDRKLNDADIYIQKVNATGDIQWTPNGTVICTIVRNQRTPQIISDDEGGAIIAWRDFRNYNNDIYIQRINSTGDPLWVQNGTEISTAIEGQEGTHLLKDGKGGAYIMWQDDRGFGAYWWDVYMQLINSTGDIQWDLNGTAISTANEAQEFPQFINNQGQLILVWQDERNKDTTGKDIYAHKIVDNMRPASNQLIFVNTMKYTNETIDWVLTDDWGEGQYRVKTNDTSGNYIIWQDWQPWTNNTPLNIPINRTLTGIFNYTIEFYDMYNLTGDPNTVIVNIEEGTPPEGSGPGGGIWPSISFGYYYIIPLLFGIILLALKSSRKYQKRKN